jgi:hypothetical protein
MMSGCDDGRRSRQKILSVMDDDMTKNIDWTMLYIDWTMLYIDWTMLCIDWTMLCIDWTML